MGRDEEWRGFRLTRTGPDRFDLAFDLAGAAPADAPLPTQESLDAVLRSIDVAVLREGGAWGGKAIGGAELARFEGEVLDELCVALHVELPIARQHCMCNGDFALELFRGTELVTTIGLHHGQSIRTSFWSSDARFVDGPGFLAWLAAHGAPAPLARVRATEDALARDREARRRFRESMPAALSPLADAIEKTVSVQPALVARALAALRAEATDERVALAVLRWLGTPRSRWTGYPSPEAVPEAILASLPIELVARVLDTNELDDELREGGARYLGGWSLSKREPRALALLSRERRAALRAHVEADGDADKLSRWTAAERRADPSD